MHLLCKNPVAVGFIFLPCDQDMHCNNNKFIRVKLHIDLVPSTKLRSTFFFFTGLLVTSMGLSEVRGRSGPPFSRGPQIITPSMQRQTSSPSQAAQSDRCCCGPRPLRVSVGHDVIVGSRPVMDDTQRRQGRELAQGPTLGTVSHSLEAKQYRQEAIVSLDSFKRK